MSEVAVENVTTCSGMASDLVRRFGSLVKVADDRIEFGVSAKVRNTPRLIASVPNINSSGKLSGNCKVGPV
jgi:hypothetical protein